MAEYGGYGGEGYGGYGDSYGDGYGDGYGGDGGGYGGGSFADQGQGGGFNGGAGSQGSGRGSPSRGKTKSTSTLTIRQLQSATYDEAESKYMYENTMLSHCVIIGEIVELEEKTNCLILHLEDGTGHLVCSHWNNSQNANDGEDSAPTPDHGLAVGMWVRVSVRVKEFGKKQTASVYGIVKDPFQGNFDAITHHYLQCIFEHLGRTKGTLAKLKAGAVSGGANATCSSAVYGQPEAFVAQRSKGVKVESAGAAAGDLLAALKNIFGQEPPEEHGWSFGTIMERLPALGFGSVGESEVRNHVSAMCDDGALYSTVDDDHWLSTS